MKLILTSLVALLFFTCISCSPSHNKTSSEPIPLAGHWKSFREVQLDEKGNVKREATAKNNLVVSKRGAFIYWNGLEADTGINIMAQPYFFNQVDSLLGVGSNKLEDFVSIETRPSTDLFIAYLQDSILVLQPATLELNPKPLAAKIYLKKIK